MRAEAPACPPNARQSSASTEFLPILHRRSRKPRRTGANDHDIKNTVRVDGPNKPDAASQLSFGWVAQQRPSGHKTIGNWLGSMWKRSISAFASWSFSGSSS